MTGNSKTENLNKRSSTEEGILFQGQLKDRHITGYGWRINQETWVLSSFHDSLLSHRNQRGADGCKNGDKESEYGWEEGD